MEANSFDNQCDNKSDEFIDVSISSSPTRFTNSIESRYGSNDYKKHMFFNQILNKFFCCKKIPILTVPPDNSINNKILGYQYTN